MPPTLPLEIVLDIVRTYIQRDFLDEDWPAYHSRLAPLCLVGKYLRSIVQPVLWSHLSLSYAAELKKLAAADSTISHLFKHVKAFAGLHPLHCPRFHAGKQSFKLIRCTPSLRRLYLANLADHNFPDDLDEPFLPIQDIDLRRVEAVQLKPETLEVFRSDLPALRGPFSDETEILLSWTAKPHERFWGSFELSRHLQIHISPYMLEQTTSQFADSIPPVLDHISSGKHKVIFLPSTVRSRAATPTWIQRGFRTLFDACLDADVPIYFYHDTSEDSSLRMSDAFLRFLDNPSMPDENPLKIEWERWGREGLPGRDDGTLWDFAKGFDEGSESGEKDGLGNDD
ncbi:hypothetical protein RTBOTA2_003292 [Rhodotorula toruloides]|nr:hypothetical protein RTBOTA2_003292 [Rhodotorula toruloides]